MTSAGVRVGIGTRVMFDGEVHEVIEWIPSTAGTEVVLKSAIGLRRMSVVALVSDPRVKLIADPGAPEPTDDEQPAAVKLLCLSDDERRVVTQRAEHVREVLTGYRSGSEQIRQPDEPRAAYDPALPMCSRFESKAAELAISRRTVDRWVKAYRETGEAGLAPNRTAVPERVDERWTETARCVMSEYTNESKPSMAAVILQTHLRIVASYGDGEIEEPSRATAYRKLAELDRRHQTFRGTTKRNRDIAGRGKHPYGKLRPNRPGEYLILDTTPLDVFAMDPVTLRWVRLELSAAMDWYTRCVVSIRLTPMSTKAVDAAALMYAAFRPPPACDRWPDYAVWPAHGIPRQILIDPDQIDRTGRPASGPALSPDTIVVDHGKIYVSEHLNSVCQRMGISIQPVRIREGRDKGPLERFFNTVRHGLLQFLPGYKGPDINSRGLDVESHAFFYLDELEAILREWVAAIYHHRRHRSLFDPGLPAGKLTPAQMFQHGMARAGYLEVPRDPHLAYEFLSVEARTIQHYGVQRRNLFYRGEVLEELSAIPSPYTGRFKDRWPIHFDPDDISRVYIRHPITRSWHELPWEHAAEVPMPFSDETLRFARRAVLDQHGFIDDRLALIELAKRWQLGLGISPAERRMSLRLARQHAALSNQVETDDDESAVNRLPSVSALTAGASQVRRDSAALVSAHSGGDDDDPEELQADYVEYEELEWA